MHPITILMGFPAGSGVDVVARMLQEPMEKSLGGKIVTDYRTGAGGNLASEAVARAKPDGYMLLLGTAATHGVNAALYKSLPFDVEADFTPIAPLVNVSNVLTINPQVIDVSTVREFIDVVKKNPGKYNYASMGAGTISHLAMEALATKSGTSVVHVPYAGSGPAVTALLAGNADMAVLPAAAVMPQVKAGKVKALAVATAKRSASLPELPTLAESGLQDIEADAWMGFVVPAKTPEPIVKKLHEELVAILADPEVREKLKLQYMDVVADTPAEARAWLAADIERWRPIIQKNNITLD